MQYRKIWPVACLCLILVGCSDAPPALEESESGGANWAPERIDRPHLPNALRLHEKVISGGQPGGELGFKELSDLGVKTVVSVDGAQPDVVLARKYGLRYVHLPHGYDGVPEDRARELAKVVRDLPGPIYIHCHHGKHRSPAAASVACVGAGLLQPEFALSVLRTAGTSDGYRGLYESAQKARRFDETLLAESMPFPETVAVPPMAEAMVSIEHTHDHLKSIAQNKWQPLAEHPDLEPAHEALLLREHYTELLRTKETLARPARFQDLLRESEAAAKDLEAGLRDKAHPEHSVPAALNKSFDLITKNCKACHSEFRDVPLSEKVGRS